MELTDSDKRPDFIVTTCDNGEYPAPTKSYHGIRIYLTQGDAKFKHSLYPPLNGAFRALPGDYEEEGDGDIDLALGNYMFGPGKAIFVPDFLTKT